MCIINGRLCPEYDNFTCVRTNGSSVVDYVSTFQDNLENCKSFKVHLARPLLGSLNIFDSSIPDHSILEFDFIPHFMQDYDGDSSQNNNHEKINNSSNIQDNNRPDTYAERYFERYKIREMPVNFLDSPTARNAIIECINIIEKTRADQEEVDSIYERVCNIYYDEMSSWFKSHNINTVSKKKFRNSPKPYWNDHLSQLWDELCLAENTYLKSPQHSKTRRVNLNIFKGKRHNFDKFYRKYKRKFNREKKNSNREIEYR